MDTFLEASAEQLLHLVTSIESRLQARGPGHDDSPTYAALWEQAQHDLTEAADRLEEALLAGPFLPALGVDGGDEPIGLTISEPNACPIAVDDQRSSYIEQTELMRWVASFLPLDDRDPIRHYPVEFLVLVARFSKQAASFCSAAACLASSDRWQDLIRALPTLKPSIKAGEQELEAMKSARLSDFLQSTAAFTVDLAPNR